MLENKKINVGGGQTWGRDGNRMWDQIMVNAPTERGATVVGVVWIPGISLGKRRSGQLLAVYRALGAVLIERERTGVNFGVDVSPRQSNFVIVESRVVWQRGQSSHNIFKA